MTAGQRRRHGGRHGGHRLTQDRGAQLEPRLPLERPLPRRQLVEHDPERPDVAARVRRPAPQLLRRHVHQRARQHARLRQRLPRRRRRVGELVARQPLRQAEVEHLDLAFRRHHHVRALEVAMHDAPRVRVRQRAGQLLPVPQDLLDRQRAAGHPLAERLPFDELHRDVGLAIGFAHVVDRADVGMVQFRGQPRLAHEPRPCGLVGQGFGGQHLQSHVTLKPRVARPVDFAHAARADGGVDFVRAEASAGRKGHQRSGDCSTRGLGTAWPRAADAQRCWSARAVQGGGESEGGGVQRFAPPAARAAPGAACGHRGGDFVRAERGWRPGRGVVSPLAVPASAIEPERLEGAKVVARVVAPAGRAPRRRTPCRSRMFRTRLDTHGTGGVRSRGRVLRSLSVHSGVCGARALPAEDVDRSRDAADGLQRPSRFTKKSVPRGSRRQAGCP